MSQCLGRRQNTEERTQSTEYRIQKAVGGKQQAESGNGRPRRNTKRGGLWSGHERAGEVTGPTVIWFVEKMVAQVATPATPGLPGPVLLGKFPRAEGRKLLPQLLPSLLPLLPPGGGRRGGGGPLAVMSRKTTEYRTQK